MRALLTEYLILSLSFVSLVRGESVEDRPEPGSMSVPVQQEAAGPDAQPDPAPRNPHVSCVRIWNLAHRSSAGGLGLFFVQGSPPHRPESRQWMARGSRPGEFRNYREFEPGRYQLVVIPDPSRQGQIIEPPEDIDPEGDRMITPPIAITLHRGSHLTVLLRDSPGGQLEVEFFNDSDLIPKKLRVFNLVPGLKPGVARWEAGSIEILARQVTDRALVELAADTGLLLLEMGYPGADGGQSARMNGEIEMGSVRSGSVIFAPDRYGRVSVRCVTDAPLLPAR